ncbi:hypothetical protein BASA50_005325 [Batrachochytrium salamandrivorans]|uniref:Uncharacterized protein n=1 Tax=Batrachochytrium salamandrivorans TaxID=1357716 RepID=A0ABQ8FG73_9FUNG|nr:hypothetical protein BASA50_005325 [Batrachochytrium salamandrivorans]
MDSLNTPSTTAATTTTTTTTTAVHFSRRARTSRSAGKVPSDIIGEAEHTQTQIPPKVSKKQTISDTKAPTTTESSIKQVHFSRRAPTKRTTKPKQVNISITKPETRISLSPSQIPRLTTALTTQYELQPSSKVSLNSRIPISPRMVKANPQVDLKNSQSSAFKKTLPIHGSAGSVLTGDEESKCIDLSHESNTGMDAIAAVVLSGGVGGLGVDIYMQPDDVISPRVVANTGCVGVNLDTIGIITGTRHRSKTMTDTGVILSDGVARAYSNSTMQLDSISFPEIVVGVGGAGGNVDPNGICTGTQCGNTTMTDTGVILSGGSVRVYSNSPTRLDSSSSPEVAVKGMCVGKKIVADSRVRVHKPCGRRIMTAAAAGIHSDEPTTRLDDTISDSLLLVSREHYFEQFDISRVDDDRGKACKDVQAYDGGHLLDTLTSAVDYVERHQGNSIYEQDAAHMGPEVVCRGDPQQMDSSHSDYYRQTVYRSNLDILAASAISDAVDYLECPTALLQLCDIALDDGPLRPAWPLQGASMEHFSMSIPLIRNITPAPAPSAAMVTSAPAATAKQGSTASRSKKAASIKRGGLSTAPISHSAIGSEKEDAGSLTGKRTRKDGGPPIQRKRVASKKPANPLATAGDTMPTDDELKVMAYIASSLRIVPYSSELFEIHSTNLTCLPGSSNSSTMKYTDKEKDETVDLLLALNGVGARSLDFYMDAIESKQFASASQFRATLLMDLQRIEAALGADGEAGGDHLRRTLVKLFKLFGSLWEFYFPLVDDISQRNSGRRRCNARPDLGLTLAAALPSSSSLPARLKNKRAATELTDLDTAAPKRLCKL